MSWFQNLFDARRKIAECRKEYNEERPHSSLGYRTPKEFAAQAGSFYRAELGQEASKRRPLAPDPHPRSRRRWNRTSLPYSYVNESRGQVSHVQFLETRVGKFVCELRVAEVPAGNTHFCGAPPRSWKHNGSTSENNAAHSREPRLPEAARLSDSKVLTSLSPNRISPHISSVPKTSASVQVEWLLRLRLPRTGWNG